MPASLTLTPLSPADFPRVAHIRVTEPQARFSGTVQQALETARPAMDFHAILLDSHPVGFFRIDRAYAEHHWFARKNEPGLMSFQIDLPHQNRGIGTASIRALDGYLQQIYPEIPSIVLTVYMANRPALRTYRSGGFTDTGEIWEEGATGPQLVMRMTLKG